jgi:hypothetical protein
MAAEGESGPRRITRREVMRDGSVLAVAVLAGGALGEVAVAARRGQTAYLDADELKALRALVDVFIPADLDPGALGAECAEAIDALLGAFEASPPRIYAGAPFSDRAGSPVNHFERFLALDPYEAKAWRLRIRGSRGKPELEFNGPVPGWQRIYSEGLAALNEASLPLQFGDLPAPARELILETSDDPRIAALVDVSFPHTLQFMYGAPEYGGNKDLVGWGFTEYDGDVQPRGWTRRQIEELDSGPRASRAAAMPSNLLAVAALAGSPELAHGIVAQSGSSLKALQEAIAPLALHLRGSGDGG